MPKLSEFQSLADLSLEVEQAVCERYRSSVPGPFDRQVSLIRLCGQGHEGVGEDVSYETEDHAEFQLHAAKLPLCGQYRLGEFSDHLDQISLYGRPPVRESSRHYRRWALESAALDLALRQQGCSLHEFLQLKPKPLRYVVSLSVRGEEDLARIRAIQAIWPDMGFKVDVSPAWDDGFCRQLADLQCVKVVDFKGYYQGTSVSLQPDPELYRRVAEFFPEAFLEDPWLDSRTLPVLQEYRQRVTWDAPISSIADVEAFPWLPQHLNLKPSRSGRLQTLWELYSWCEERQIQLYAGGQYELGPGRGQAQYLASLFHPEACNDIAPVVFHGPEPPQDHPGSPLPPTPESSGFSWQGPSLLAPWTPETRSFMQRLRGRLRRWRNS